MQTLAILVAAGRGERMGGGRPKAFLEVGSRPLLWHAARALLSHDEIEALVAVVPESHLETARQVLSGSDRIHAVVPGGARRQDSVRAGLAATPTGFGGVVLVHDAARPFVPTSIVAAVLAAARAAGAAVPVLPLADTIKRVVGDRVVSTLDRQELAAAQTPQAFRLELLLQAYAAADGAGLEMTDEAMAVERLGHLVRAVPGSPHSRKLTTPEDLAWAEQRLAEART